jgi:hypothetical protein
MVPLAPKAMRLSTPIPAVGLEFMLTTSLLLVARLMFCARTVIGPLNENALVLDGPPFGLVLTLPLGAIIVMPLVLAVVLVVEAVRLPVVNSEMLLPVMVANDSDIPALVPVDESNTKPGEVMVSRAPPVVGSVPCTCRLGLLTLLPFADTITPA